MKGTPGTSRLRGSQTSLKKAKPKSVTRKVKKTIAKKSQEHRAEWPEKIPKISTMDTIMLGAGPALIPEKVNKLKDLPIIQAATTLLDTIQIGAGPALLPDMKEERKKQIGAGPALLPDMKEERKKQEHWKKTEENQWLKEENARKDKQLLELQEKVAAFSFSSPATSEFRPREEDIGAPRDNLVEDVEDIELEDVQRTITIIQGCQNPTFQQKLLDKMMEDYMCLGPGKTRQKTLMEEFLQKFNVPIQSKSSLKLSVQTLPQFSGKECDYFDWKVSVQEILACTSTSAGANLVAVKNSCFKDCGDAVKNCIKTVQSLQMLFEVLDARFGSKTAHATRISKEISSLKNIASGNYQAIISFVENFENSKRLAENSNISECFVNLPIYVELSNKLSPELLNEYLIQFPIEDIPVELKMQNMQQFLGQIKDRAIKAKNLRYNDDNKPHRSAKVNVVSLNNELHASKNAEGGGAVNALKIDPSPEKRMAKWPKKGARMARMARGIILSVFEPISVCCAMTIPTGHLIQNAGILGSWKKSTWHNLEKRVYAWFVLGKVVKVINCALEHLKSSGAKAAR